MERGWLESETEEQETALYAAIGRAISRWANIESALVYAFSVTTRVPMRTCATLFMQVKTFALSLELVDAAVREALRTGGAQSKDKTAGSGRIGLIYWASIVGYIRELSGDRNYLAHVPVVVEHGDEVLVRVGPPIIAWHAGLYADPKRPPLDIEEVKQLTEDFKHAHGVLANFCAVYQTHETLPQRYFEPVARRRPPRKQRLENARRTPKAPRRSSPL